MLSAVLLLFWLSGRACLFRTFDTSCGTFTALELLGVVLCCGTTRMRLFVEVENDLALPTEAILPVRLLPRDSESATVILFLHVFIIGPRREKTCLWGFANNTGADQPAHPRSLISAFVIRFLESSICKLATGEISIHLLVSVAEEPGLKLA